MMSNLLSYIAVSAFDGLIATGWQSAILFAIVLIGLRLLPLRRQKQKANLWRATMVVALLLWPLNGFLAYGQQVAAATSLNQPHVCLPDGSCCHDRNQLSLLIAQQAWLKSSGLGFWGVGVSGCVLFLIWGRQHLHKQLTDCSPLPTPGHRPIEVNSKLAHPIPVFESSRLAAPLTVGIIGRQIVLPQGLNQLLSEDELQVVLAHEQAHAVRRDVLWSVFAAINRSIFFFHPAFWIAERELRASQEWTADELARNWTSHTPEAYAQLLLSSCHKLGRQSSFGSWQLGFLSPESLLRQRLRVLLADHSRESLRSTRWIFVGLAGIVCLLIESSWNSADLNRSTRVLSNSPALVSAESSSKPLAHLFPEIPDSKYSLSCCAHTH